MKRILTALSAVVLFVCVLAIGRSVLSTSRSAGKANPAAGPHVLSMPYYSTKGDWESILTLNNATHGPLTASLTIYSLDGTALPLSDVILQPDLHAALRISDLLGQVERRGRFQEGSIDVRFNGSPMDLGAQLTVSDAKHGLSFDMEPPMAFKSSTLEGLWWSLDGKTSGQVMLSNTASRNLDLQVNVEWQGNLIPAQPISLSAHETVILKIEELLKDVHVNATGIERGGLSITHNGAPGGLIAHGVVQNKEAHFASNLSFIDPAAQKSSVLNGTGLMLAHPASNVVFPGASFFVPRLALRNASASSQTASVTVQYTIAGGAHSQDLPIINLAPHEVRMVDLSTLLNSVSDASLDDAGVRIESSGPAGSLIAQLTSIDQKTSMSVDVPLLSVSPSFIGTGAHPFHLDGDSQAVVHLKNLAAEPTTAIVQVLYEGGEFSPELIPLAPGQSVSVDIRQLRDSRARDVHGHQLPLDLTTGEVQWFQHGKKSLIGRLVASSASLGVSASFACGGVCCPPSFSSSTVDPGSLVSSPAESFSVTVWETDETCGQFYGPYNITAYSSCTSTDSGVAQVSGSSIEMVNEGECTINVDHLASTFTRPPSECDGPCEINCDETDTMMTEPVPASVRTPHHVVVVRNQYPLSIECAGTTVMPAERDLVYAVVDVSGRSVGRTRVKEFFNAESQNSCGNGQPEPTGCNFLSLTNQFPDNLTVNCNSVGGSCGYQLCWEWDWCPLGRSAVTLASFFGTIHNDSVTLNGFDINGSERSVDVGIPLYKNPNVCP